jgi:hypothetical protein
MLANNVPVNNPGVNLGGVVARAIYWRQQLSERTMVIEVNPDSVLARVGLAKRVGNCMYYRVVERLRKSITLRELFSLEKIKSRWGTLGIGGDVDGSKAYSFCKSDGKKDLHKDYLMAIAAGLCGISYVRNQVLLPCTATRKTDLGEPFASDGWMYLPLVRGEPPRCSKCSA